MESNTRFKIRTYIELAKMSDETTRKECIETVLSLIDSLGECNGPSKREECKQYLREIATGKTIKLADVYDSALRLGYSYATTRRAIESMDDATRWQTGFGPNKVWYFEIKKD